MARRLQAACLIAFTILLAGCHAGNEGRFTLVNDSAEQIASARVEVCGQVSEYRDLAPGAQEEGVFRVGSDSDYNVSVTFASGRRLSSEVGYVTNGLDWENAIAVTDSSIDITGGPVPASD